jgi:hypothetical protein
VTEAYNAAVDVWKDREKALQAGSTTEPLKRDAKPVLHVVSPNEKEIVTRTEVEKLYRTREACQSAWATMRKSK